MESRLLKRVSYQGRSHYLHLTSYTDGNLALILHPDADLYRSPEEIVLSVNLDDLAPGELAIRDNDYHAGNFAFLVQEGVLTPLDKTLKSGFVTYPVGRLLL